MTRVYFRARASVAQSSSIASMNGSNGFLMFVVVSTRSSENSIEFFQDSSSVFPINEKKDLANCEILAKHLTLAFPNSLILTKSCRSLQNVVEVRRILQKCAPCHLEKYMAIDGFLQYGFFCTYFSGLPHGVWEQHAKAQKLLFS